MDWLGIVIGSTFALFLIAPPLLVLAGVFGLLISHVIAPPAMVSRTSFDCPVRKCKVSVAFESRPGETGTADVVSCSAFEDPEKVTCAKGCLGVATTKWAPSPMVPRYALTSDGVVYR